MERIIRSLLILGSTAVAIVCFQNCSNVNFSAAPSEAVTKIGIINEENGEEEAPPATDSELRATCQNLRNNQGNLYAIANGGSLVDVGGNSLLKAAGNLTTLTRVYGNVNILGTQTGSAIGSIDASHGNIIVCGMSVVNISNSNGNLVIVGGDVGDVENFNGNLRLVGGQITGSVSNSNGNLASN